MQGPLFNPVKRPKVGRIYMGKDWQFRDISEESNVTDQAQSNTRHEEEKQRRQNRSIELGD